MRINSVIILSFILLMTGCGHSNIDCTIQTELGDIVVELYPDKAPITVNNFLDYIDAGLYDSTSFFRVCTPLNESDRSIRIEVIQGGDVSEDESFSPIEIETTNKTGLKHLDGTLSMARAEPNTAQASYFICIGEQPELDHEGKRNPDGYGFAAFGQVTAGMDVVRKIQAQPDSGQMLIHPVLVLSIERVCD